RLQEAEDRCRRSDEQLGIDSAFAVGSECAAARARLCDVLLFARYRGARCSRARPLRRDDGKSKRYGRRAFAERDAGGRAPLDRRSRQSRRHELGRSPRSRALRYNERGMRWLGLCLIALSCARSGDDNGILQPDDLIQTEIPFDANAILDAGSLTDALALPSA